jgi:recombination protein U
MPSWNSRGLRGSLLEEMVNMTNDKYKTAGLALVQKIPTPITPVEIDKQTKQITLGYFEQKSTVDYIGVVQGIPICFDAKESKEDTFELKNVHEHQVDFMEAFEKQNGVAFLLIMFTGRDSCYYMRYSELASFWKRALDGGRKSIRQSELDPDYFFSKHTQVFIPYLDMVKKDLDEREE